MQTLSLTRILSLVISGLNYFAKRGVREGEGREEGRKRKKGREGEREGREGDREGEGESEGGRGERDNHTVPRYLVRKITAVYVHVCL